MSLIQNIVKEVESYASLKDLERLVENGNDLSALPPQPIYHLTVNEGTSQLAELLPKLSVEQRQFLLDADNWHKDNYLPQNFERWLMAYAACKDENIVQDFVSSEDFLLYIKGRVNIMTFDTEDPQYPDHDFYFLTDDNLLLFEYGENYPYANELKYLIRNLYSKMGVEHAYTFLFKLINDNFFALQEYNFEQRNQRVRDYGLVDYYHALNLTHPLVNEKAIAVEAAKKEPLYYKEIEPINISSPSFAMNAWREEDDLLAKNLAVIKDEKLQLFLQQNFQLLINAQLVATNNLTSDRLSLKEEGQHLKALIILAIDYLTTTLNFSKPIFEYFDFITLFKIGKTLVEVPKTKLKKNFTKMAVDDITSSFWGDKLNESIEEVFGEVPKIDNEWINSCSKRNQYLEIIKSIEVIAPIVKKYHDLYQSLLASNTLNDSFYLNTNLTDISFEMLMLTNLCNHALNNLEVKKLGLTVVEFKEVWKQWAIEVKDNKFTSQGASQVTKICQEFLEQMQLQSQEFTDYLAAIFKDNLEGYDFDSMSDDEFKYMGGVILLNS